jgi:F-type H+-transporting ATPase subunit delta
VTTSSGSTGLVDRYASALFALADSAGSLDETAQELTQIDAMIRSSHDLGRLLRSPVINRRQQGKAVDAVLKAAGVGDLSRRFVGVVAENRRLPALQAMIIAFHQRLAERRGETAVQVISAKPLSPAQTEAVTQVLQKAVGRNVALTLQTDKSLLGGMIVKIGSRMVDSSLKTKMQRLGLAIKGIG